MEIIHVSAECYPYAKAGGLGDVVGALPKYQNLLGHQAKVIVPMYKTPFLFTHQWHTIYKGSFNFGNQNIEYTIILEQSNITGFELYAVDIYGLLDREKIYGYEDDQFRFLAFQIAVTNWISSWNHHPDVVHVHDFHAGLIPFFMKHSFAYRHLSGIKTVCTIHNAQYQGWMDWDMSIYFPEYDEWKRGLLEWNHRINPLAAAIKCSDSVTTVSPTYMQELTHNSNGLELLFEYEKGKCLGILNGIDIEVWNPQLDTMIDYHYDEYLANEGKHMNKKSLCHEFGLQEDLPLFVFIGRLVGEKAADLLPEVIQAAFHHFRNRFCFLVLGNGNPVVEQALSYIHHNHFGYYHSRITFNESLSHRMYAGADFLLMPSRIEPCGLNQLYAMRYGTMPLVRRTGGLQDTVVDIGDEGGFGICFNHASVLDILHAMSRAIDVYEAKAFMTSTRKKMMTINHGWHKSAGEYLELYQKI